MKKLTMYNREVSGYLIKTKICPGQKGAGFTDNYSMMLKLHKIPVPNTKGD